MIIFVQVKPYSKKQGLCSLKCTVRPRDKMSAPTNGKGALFAVNIKTFATQRKGCQHKGDFWEKQPFCRTPACFHSLPGNFINAVEVPMTMAAQERGRTLCLLSALSKRGSAGDELVMWGLNGQKVELKINTKVECPVIIMRTEK